MSTALGHATSPALVALAETIAGQLEELLEAEFEDLKVPRLDDLDSLQSRKTALLEQLGQVVPVPLGGDSPAPAEWSAFAERMRHCKQLHRRNEILVQRRLDTVRGAISALQMAGEGLIDETYDRSGRLGWGGSARGRRARNSYNEA